VIEFAIRPIGTFERALIDAICTHSYDDLTKIAAAYKRIWKKDMVEEILDEHMPSKQFKRLIAKLFEVNDFFLTLPRTNEMMCAQMQNRQEMMLENCGKKGKENGGLQMTILLSKSFPRGCLCNANF
jgi:inorganic pyrophosphatase/exopolyphosphatase